MFIAVIYGGTRLKGNTELLNPKDRFSISGWYIRNYSCFTVWKARRNFRKQQAN